MATPWEVDDTAETAPWEVDDTGKLKRTLSQKAQAYGGKDPGVLKQALGGAKHAWDRAAYGLAGLVGQGTPEQKQLLDEGKAFVQETGPASTIGQIGGDVAMTAVPAVKLAKATARFGKYAPAAADALFSAGYGGLTADEGKGAAGAMMGAAGSGVGSGVGNVLGRIASPTGRLAPEAQGLINEGIPLTPGQAAPDTFMGGIEPWLAKVPVVGGAVRARQQDAADATLGVLAKKLGLNPADVSGIPPQEIVQLLATKVDDAYTSAALSAVDLPTKFQFDLMSSANQIQNLQGLPFGVGKDTTRELSLAMRLIKNAQTPEEAAKAWKNADSWLGSQGAVMQPVQDMWRQSFHRVAPKNASKQLLEADLLSRQVRAIEKGVGTKTDVTPEQLVRGLRSTKIDPKQVQQNAGKYIPADDAAALGTKAAGVNTIANDAAELAKRKQAPWVIPQAAAALGAGAYWGGASTVLPAALGGATAARLSYTPTGVKYLTGQMPGQNFISDLLRTGAAKRALRRLGASSAGAVINNEEE